MSHFAHSGTPGDTADWQPLADHLRAVAARAAVLARPFGLDRAACLAGLFHDLGKYDPAFQRRLQGAQIAVDHSTAGARILHDLAADALRDRKISFDDMLVAQLLSFGILGHHAGLPDRSTDEPGCFDRRFERFADRLDPTWRRELSFELPGLMPAGISEALADAGNAKDGAAAPARRRQRAFELSVIGRFLFSCLVDADYKDTEAYYEGLRQRTPDRAWGGLQDLLPAFAGRFDAHMAVKRSDGDVNRLRGSILAHVRGKAAMAPGLFTLTVPTGGGKTLASLGFALDHARLHGHRRIIYAIPFTSIIDQVADIFRDILGDDNVLEHHSAIEDNQDEARRGRPSTGDRMRLAMEDWAAPVVVTTNVQLFESLFAARTSRARKLHNIAGSIVVLDEAQTIPRPLLKPCVRMLDALARLFGCTIVLCTATQPALGAPAFPDGLALDGRELAPDPHGLARQLRRARIEQVGAMDNAALVAALATTPQGLVIVNSRRHALDLFTQAKQAGLDGLVHLTTRQCAAHRRALLADVRHRLKHELPCRVIATSLIEAGVDVDFPRVWRAEAGLDSIVQASGRCNREGRNQWQDSVVQVFRAPDYPPPREIAGLIGDMGRMVTPPDGDLLSLDAIQAYFAEVYWRAGSRLDAESILDQFDLGTAGANFGYREVARKFRMIDSNMQPVIIVFDEKAQKAVHEISVAQISSGAIARKLQSYVVQVRPQDRDALIRNGHVEFVRSDLRGDQFAVLRVERVATTANALYNGERGLLWEDAAYLATDNFLI